MKKITFPIFGQQYSNSERYRSMVGKSDNHFLLTRESSLIDCNKRIISFILQNEWGNISPILKGDVRTISCTLNGSPKMENHFPLLNRRPLRRR